MTAIPDPVRVGPARGWQVIGGPHGAAPESLSCDVAIVGGGPGAGITAELLTAAGHVVIIEEGPLSSSADYWTSSFRTHSDTLKFWREHFGLSDLTDAAMAPCFQQAEQRLSISPWLAMPKDNNQLLRIGAARLGIPAAAIMRNVKGYHNPGSCGMGCPTNAKQSVLVTTLPAALDRSARLLVQTRVQRVLIANGRAQGLECVPVALNGAQAARPGRRITARHFGVAGGAINSLARLMRSKVADPHARPGARTFLHPVVLSAATFEQRIECWSGAPQTLCTDHFPNTAPIDGHIGCKLKAPPMHPIIFSLTPTGFGAEQAAAMTQFPHTDALLALLRDGFNPLSAGGKVGLRGDGSPELDDSLSDVVTDGARRDLPSMTEIQFAAGAKTVTPSHERVRAYVSRAGAGIAQLPMKPLLTRVFSAHVMGGCSMPGRADQGVVRPDGRHWQLEGLWVHDGSLFPTSVDANPQLSIYGLVAKLATGLARSLTGQDVRLA